MTKPAKDIPLSNNTVPDLTSGNVSIQNGKEPLVFNHETKEHEKIPPEKESTLTFLRKWLVVPVCFLYGASIVTSALVIKQFVYSKVLREKFPNITLNSTASQCHLNESDPSYALQTEAQEVSAQWMTYYGLSFGIPCVFSDLILGSYTDRLGRKFLFFLPCIALFIDIAVCAVGIYTDFALVWYIPSNILHGLSGHAFGFLLATFSYSADITKPGKERSLGIVVIELSIGIASTGVSLTTGFFMQKYGFFWPIVSGAILAVFTILLICFMPETYPKEKRQQAASARDTMRNAFRLFFGKENYGNRWKYSVLMSIFILTIFTALGRSTVETLYQLNNPFCWDPKRLGWFMAIRSGCQQVLGMALVKPLQYIVSDETIGILGSLSLIAGFTFEGLANTDALLYAGKIKISVFFFSFYVVVHTYQYICFKRNMQFLCYT